MAAGTADEGSARPAPRRRGSGELSGLVLDVLREAGRALTPTEVQRRLAAAGTTLAHTTVVTTLSRLQARGRVERFRTGRTHAYTAVTDPARLAARRMRHVLDAEDDRDAVLTSFVENLAPGDESLLRELLNADLHTGNSTGSSTPDR